MGNQSQSKTQIVFSSFSFSIGEEARDRPSIVVTGRVTSLDQVIATWSFTVGLFGQRFEVSSVGSWATHNQADIRNQIIDCMIERLASSEILSPYMKKYLAEHIAKIKQ